MTTWAVVVAAGGATRFGRPKQYEPLGDRRVLDWSLAAARSTCEGVVLVVPRGSADAEPQADVVVEGAATRPGSVRRGLAAVPPEVEIIVVHDAARPLARPSLFRAVVDAVRDGADGSVCALPVADTVKKVEAAVVQETVSREGLWAVQTPQAFSAAMLRRAHAWDPEATDDSALVEAIGGRVVVVEGDPHNLKLTVPADLEIALALLTTLD
jgi:2-C-methyl-D-erythritol 4-phosphate cytidylyltransferase